MSQKTKISWCDSTLNFWEGCTKVSAGCANCYAEARNKRFNGVTLHTKLEGDFKIGMNWGKGAPRRKSKSAVKDALAYNRKPWICDECGYATTWEESAGLTCCPKCAGELHRRRIFSLSLGDWLDGEVDIAWLAEMLDTIRQCDQVTWILCTKRPENWDKRINSVRLLAFKNKNNDLESWLHKWLMKEIPPTNIILLASVENQEQADKRLPVFHTIPAVCHGLSLEPLLGPVMLQGEANGKSYNWLKDFTGTTFDGRAIDWLIIGGESGPNASPCNVDDVRLLVNQGVAAGVPVHVKQLGANSVFTNTTTHLTAMNLRDKKGGDPSEWPADLRIQEFPKL